MDCVERLPERFGPASRLGLSESGPFADRLNWTRRRVESGIDSLYVAELIVEGILDDLPYIMTDAEHEAQVDARFAAIKKGFDRIRNRAPRF